MYLDVFSDALSVDDIFISLNWVECERYQIQQEFADFLEGPPNGLLPRICKHLKQNDLGDSPPPNPLERW